MKILRLLHYLYPSLNKFISYKTNPSADGMENIGTMVLGFLSLPSLGPFLGAYFGNN